MRYTNYCSGCGGMIDFFDSDVTEIDDDGNMVVECPYCGTIFTSSINTNKLMDDLHGELDYE